MTLDETIRAEAPQGVSERECPGGWIAIVAKVGTRCHVRYLKASDHPVYVESCRRNAVAMLPAA